MEEWHHTFCRVYGWMSPKEFYEELTVPEFFEHAAKIKRDAEKDEEDSEKAIRKIPRRLR